MRRLYKYRKKKSRKETEIKNRLKRKTTCQGISILENKVWKEDGLQDKKIIPKT